MKQMKTAAVPAEHSAINKGSLILVNKDNPIYAEPSDKNLVEVAPDIRLEKQTALLYETALRQVNGASKIVPVSGYRSRTEQEQLFADSLAEHGTEYTRTYVALPGSSEHQTGLAIDVAQKAEQIDYVTPDFPYSGVCQHFREMAVRCGFIQRYPKGKEKITGIGHEPWHFRYVGIPHSELITELGFTLEEYIEWIRNFPLESRPYHCKAGGHVFEIGFVQAEDITAEIPLRGETYTISGNNVDGFIAAIRRHI